MSKRGFLIILSGPSGTGKGTIAKILAEERGFALSVSRTTRQPRPGEIDGFHYRFTSREEFEALIEEDGFIEYAEYNGNYYGTPKDNISAQIKNGINVILEIEVKGAKKVIDTYKKELVTLFILTPSKAVMRQRLEGRGTESEEDIKKRILIADEELKMAQYYDYLIVNDTVLQAVCDIKTVIAAEGLRMSRNAAFIKKFGEGSF